MKIELGISLPTPRKGVLIILYSQSHIWSLHLKCIFLRHCAQVYEYI